GRGPADVPDPGDRPAGQDAAEVEDDDPGVLRYRRCQQRWCRGDQRTHRAGQADRSRLPQLRALPTPHAADRRRAGCFNPHSTLKSLFVVTLAVVLILSKLGGLTSVAGSKVKADD